MTAGDPLRALIVSASFGSGHHQANGALDAALRARGVPLQVRHADLLKYMSPVERTVTAGTYDLWVRHMPAVYRAFYQWTDREQAPTAQVFGWLGYRAMRRDVQEVRPEAVVSSYPTPVALADNVRRRTGAEFLNALVVTDYRVHQHWARAEADLLMVPSEEAREQMLGCRIPPERVAVTGIPIAGIYRELVGADKAALRAKHGLDPELPLILLSAGGTGSYRAQGRVLTELANLGVRVQVLVLAGADGHGVAQLGGATLHRLGFTTSFPELLAAADLVVGKAGGLTVAEATTLGVPMVIHAPIPGQEEYNALYLERRGAAIWARTLAELRPAVLRALDGDEHARMSRAAHAASQPDAADRVAAELLRRLGRV
ncbi:MGDG synthase family glycosyltransferase [Deinococcus aquaedulcis]|uniref:MGDG synthase family glycosyltransferase n=1 Tax=Deinococcus aquaedulcis TaxID=2840455 RepID=UPI002E2829D4|nr:glycosyltransferase [Deinococcus aquaedulcis]